MGGSRGEERFQFRQIRGVAAYHHLNPAVVEVPGVAMEPEPSAVAGDKPAEAYPLHFAGDEEPDGHPAPAPARSRILRALRYS